MDLSYLTLDFFNSQLCQLLLASLWCNPTNPLSNMWTLHSLSLMYERLPQFLSRAVVYIPILFKFSKAVSICVSAVNSHLKNEVQICVLFFQYQSFSKITAGLKPSPRFIRHGEKWKQNTQAHTMTSHCQLRNFTGEHLFMHMQ